MTQSIDSIVLHMQKIAQQTISPLAGEDSAPVENGVSFQAVLQNTIDQVSRMEKESSNSVERLEMGDHSRSIAAVMASVQEASIAFQEMTQLRNKLVQAYTEVMNMQV